MQKPFIDTSIVKCQPYSFTEVLVDNVGTDDKPFLKFRSDVSILLYKRKVENLDSVALNDWLSKMGEKHPSLDFSDEQFLDAIRSRYIQSPQDVQYYLEQLESEFDGLQNRTNDILAQKALDTSVETQPTASSASSE